jgi:hypothetical protein
MAFFHAAPGVSACKPGLIVQCTVLERLSTMAGNAMIYSTVASRSLGVEEHQVDSAFALT